MLFEPPERQTVLLSKPGASRVDQLSENHLSLLAAPTDRARKVGSRDLAGPVEDRQGQRTARFVLGWQPPKRVLPAAGEEILPNRPPALASLHGTCVRQHEPPLESTDGAVHGLAVGRPHEPTNLRPGQQPVLEHDLGDLAVERLELRFAKVLVLSQAPGQRVRSTEQPRRDQERSLAEVPPSAGKLPLGQLVLPTPEPLEVRREPSRLPRLVPDRPVSVEAGDPLP